MGERSQGGTIGMKKNKLFMVGFVGIMMAAALLLSGCKEEDKEEAGKKIVITGLTVEGNVVYVVDSDSKTSADLEAGIIAIGGGELSNGTLEVELLKGTAAGPTGTEKWTGTGSYYIVLAGGYVSKNKIEIKDTTTTIAYNTTNFEEF
jgi:ABC-type oligopeptide transport system substrate-binding subunit